jgi:hypothetical protein
MRLRLEGLVVDGVERFTQRVPGNIAAAQPAEPREAALAS